MAVVSQALASWLDVILGDAPIELDRAAAALLRHCRDHAGALREARSLQLDRRLAAEQGMLVTWLREHVAGDWLLPARLAEPLIGAWRIAHGPADADRRSLDATAARAVLARLIAEAIDDALGHRFVSIFRRRGEWRIGPGEPFPVVQADLRTLFDQGPLLTLPDRREAPIDRTRRLAIAPAADGIDVALDLSSAVVTAPPAADALLAAAYPIEAPTRELDWNDRRVGSERAVFHDVRPVASADVAARVEELVDQACERGVGILILPELSVDELAMGALRRALARAVAPPALIVAGSQHVQVAGALRNVATLITTSTASGSFDVREATHAKFNPYFAGDQLEDIALVPAEVRAHGLVDSRGKLTFATTILICKDFLAPGAQRALEALRPTLVLVPSWSQKTGIFETDAIGLTGKTQAIVVIVNQADPGGAGEDPAVLLVSRPVAAPADVVRRSQLAPPALLVVPLASGS